MGRGEDGPTSPTMAVPTTRESRRAQKETEYLPPKEGRLSSYKDEPDTAAQQKQT